MNLQDSSPPVSHGLEAREELATTTLCGLVQIQGAQPERAGRAEQSSSEHRVEALAPHHSVAECQVEPREHTVAQRGFEHARTGLEVEPAVAAFAQHGGHLPAANERTGTERHDLASRGAQSGNPLVRSRRSREHMDRLPVIREGAGQGKIQARAHDGHRGLGPHSLFGTPPRHVLASGRVTNLQNVAEDPRLERAQIASVGHQAIGVGLKLPKETPVARIGEPLGQARNAVGAGCRNSPVQAGDEVRVDEGRRSRGRRGQVFPQVEPGEWPLPDRRGKELQHLDRRG